MKPCRVCGSDLWISSEGADGRVFAICMVCDFVETVDPPSVPDAPAANR